MVIPIWKPYDNLSGGDRFGRGLLYIILMVWLFIGVSIVSDRFMESIEMITAQEKEVTIKDPKSGKNQIVIVKVLIVKTRDGRDGKIYESTQALQSKKTENFP